MSLLSRTQFFIKEHTGIFKLTDAYDILDPETNAPIGMARETVSGLTKWLRLIISKSLMPTTIEISESENGPAVLTIHRPFALFRAKVTVSDAKGRPLGYFQQKMLSLGGAFYVFNPDGEQVAFVKGDWKGWNFRLLDNNEEELGVVTKKWAGIGKELFTSADNYMISLHSNTNPSLAALLLAAGLAIDMVYKENKN